MTASLDRLDQAAMGWLERAQQRPLVLGLCGAQGSGKSTLAEGLAESMRGRGRRVAILSLDDLYLSGTDRGRLARDVHPLLRTRGVPLTHDVALGLALIADLRAGRPVCLPRFDKASDEPLPQRLWEPVEPSLDLLIFEGWCVGARPQHDFALLAPVNALERERDPGVRWRRAVNSALAGPYAALFAALDRLVLLAAPGFEIVRTWRLEQEETLRESLAEAAAGGLMDEAAIELFVQHYERLTRHVLAEMPERADLVLRLDFDRNLREAA